VAGQSGSRAVGNGLHGVHASAVVAEAGDAGDLWHAEHVSVMVAEAGEDGDLEMDGDDGLVRGDASPAKDSVVH
jgi:hypothetical protein